MKYFKIWCKAQNNHFLIRSFVIYFYSSIVSIRYDKLFDEEDSEGKLSRTQRKKIVVDF